MNCQEFRRKLLIEPGSRCRESADHASYCPECAALAKDALRFEEQLRAALNVPGPVGLENRINASGPGATAYCRHGFGLQRLALAACVLLSLGFAGWMGVKWEQHFRISSGLEMSVVSHIVDELDHLEIDENVGPHILSYLLSEFGARIDGDLGHVRYAGRCAIGRHFGIHMVVPGQEGPVTVLIIPGKNLLQPRRVRSTRFSGVIVPAGNGSMAVVGEKMEPVERVLEKLKRSIIWGA